MFTYITIRVFKGLLVIFLISIATFALMRLMPGDPVYLLLGEGQVQITEEQIAAIHAKWGLDKPYHEQYLIWASNLLRGDFGESIIRTGVPVGEMIFEAIPVTAALNVYALALALIVSLPIGILAAVRRGRSDPFAGHARPAMRFHRSGSGCCRRPRLRRMRRT